MLVKNTSQCCKGELGLIPNQSTKTGVNIHPSFLLKEPWSKSWQHKNCQEFGKEGWEHNLKANTLVV